MHSCSGTERLSTVYEQCHGTRVYRFGHGALQVRITRNGQWRNSLTVWYQLDNTLQSVTHRERIKTMFYHAYNNYLDNAFPYDELRPLTCDGQDTWGR